jgi:hypothetical protein
MNMKDDPQSILNPEYLLPGTFILDLLSKLNNSTDGEAASKTVFEDIVIVPCPTTL